MNLKSRQTKYGAYATIYFLVIIAVLVAANWLAANNNKSVDVTANKRFTLSDQTKKVVGGLNKDIQVYYFDQTERFDQARDMLDRYRNISSKFRVNYVDPEKKPDIARVEGARNVGDLVIDNGTKKETAKALTEEEITGALIRVLKTGTKTVCFVSGSGEHGINDTGRDGYATLKAAIEKNNLKTQTISLAEKPEVPGDCNVVIVGGPKHDYLQPTVDALKTFVQNGGGLIVNFDPVLNIPDQKMGDTPALAAMVQAWGITPKGDVVLDLGAASRLFGQLTPVAGAYESHPIVRVMNDVITAYPLARSLDVKPPGEKLVSTGENSFSLTDPKLPIKETDLEKAAKGPFTLAAAATIGAGAKAGHVVVFGSSNWMANYIISAGSVGNRDLALNTINWLTADTDLISIRPKDPEDRRLRITGRGLAILPWISLVLLPLVVILSGVSVWWKRR